VPHKVHERKFGRRTGARRGMLRNLTLSVLRYERVKTTEAKAKTVRGLVDNMINLGKDGSLESRRKALGWLPESVIVEKLFTDLANRYPDRVSGYTRTTRLARRVGDSAPLALIELMPGVDETKRAAAAEEKPATRRRRLPFRRGASAETKEDEKPAAKKTTKSTAAKKTTRKKTTATSSSKEA